jgi:hypothetical protein
MIKYVELFNFLPGDRERYLAWAEEIDTALVHQPELRRISVYENALFTTPQRVVELEFDDMAAMERYFERPEVKRIYQEWGGRCAGQTSLVLRAVSVFEPEERPG